MNGPTPPELIANWYVAPKPPAPRGWLVFSRALMLRGLQGQTPTGEARPASGAAHVFVAIATPCLAVLQAVIFLFAKIPVLHKLVEMIVTFFPRGAVGFFLRGAYWKARLRKLGQDTLIDRGVEIWGAANIEIGSCCHIDTYVRLAAGEQGFGQRGEIMIGDYVHLGPRSHIAGRGTVWLGDFVSLQARAHVYSASNALMDPAEPGKLLSFSHTAPNGLQHTIEGPVRIEEYASIGFGSLVLPNVSIGRGAVVHPYAQVVSSFPDFANIVGPGRARQNGWRRPLRVDPRAPSRAGAEAQPATPVAP